MQKLFEVRWCEDIKVKKRAYIVARNTSEAIDLVEINSKLVDYEEMETDLIQSYSWFAHNINEEDVK